MATYRRDVTLFGNAVLKVAGAVGDDSRLASKEMNRLSQNCEDTGDTLMEHWREHHGNVVAKSDS
jgi:hypothetical protein